jgi:hypothetical protein
VVRPDRLPIQDRPQGAGRAEGYAGYLVRDDYVGWHQFDPQLAGVQQCAAHYADLRIMPMSGPKVLVVAVTGLAKSA